jgi:thymidine kinase
LSDPVVVIGAEDVYQPRCDRCWHRERAGLSDPAPSLGA